MEDTNWALNAVRDWASTVAGFVIGAFFGIIRHLQDYAKPEGERPKFSWLLTLIKGVTAGGVGMLTAWLCSEWKVSVKLSGVFIALSGWGGVESINAGWQMGIDVLRGRLNAKGTSEDTAHNGPKD